LLTILQEIRDSGATVVVVEHDGELMRAADHLIDLGPGAGIEGGQLMFSGPSSDSPSSGDSPTSRYLRGELFSGDASPVAGVADNQHELFPEEPPPPQQLTIRNARRNNLQNVTVDIPLQKLVCIAGVSGSGKSSLIMESLLPIVAANCQRDGNVKVAAADADCDGIDGLDHIKRMVAVDNRPLGRNRRSCIATYSKLWNEVRKLMAKTRDARARGYDPRRFSFNTGDGRCAACKGTGLKDVRMSFLPDATVPCPECAGRRFNRATLAVKFAGKNVAEILELRVDEAKTFFEEIRPLRSLMETFCSVGLGYLTLGQAASTFSGGESQRVKLATELSAQRLESTLFLLDEPTSGLHPADVVHLNALLRGLVDAGHTVIVVEHNVDVMQHSDWLIDIGPESGPGGGHVVAQVTPADLPSVKDSLTGRFLKL